jgi:hypothetical protein
MAKRRNLSAEERLKRVEGIQGEIDSCRRHFDAARAHAEDRRHQPDRRRSPRPVIDRRHAL